MAEQGIEMNITIEIVNGFATYLRIGFCWINLVNQSELIDNIWQQSENSPIREGTFAIKRKKTKLMK